MLLSAFSFIVFRSEQLELSILILVCEKYKTIIVSHYLLGTGTSVTPPSIIDWTSRTNATNGLSKKSTSPTKTLEASASLGIFFINLFLSW